MQLVKASRKKVKLRLGLSAVSGGGKTYRTNPLKRPINKQI